MDYTAFATQKFEEIVAAIPANSCSLHATTQARIIDAGVAELGGWTSVKLLLEGLIGGRGVAQFGRQFYGGHQLPTVELLLDAPVLTYRTAFSDKALAAGVKSGGGYALGVALCDTIESIRETGNIVAAAETSLLAASLAAARAIPDAVGTLLNSGIAEEDILWGWSSSPVALLCNDSKLMAERLADARNKRIISLWVRGDDALLRPLAEGYPHGELRLHNLASAQTWARPRDLVLIP